MADYVGKFPAYLVESSVEERRNYFKNYIAPHPKLKEAVKDTVFEITSILSEGIVFVCGPTGVGKMELVKRVIKSLEKLAEPKLSTNKGCIPVVNIEAIAPAHGSFDFAELWKNGLKQLKEPLIDKKISYVDEVVIDDAGERIIISKIKKANMLDVLAGTLYFRESSALIINEAHHMLRVASGKKINSEVDVIKSLANMSKTPVVLVGTYELVTYLKDLIDSSTDQANRRAEIVEFSRYKYEVPDQVVDFCKIVNQFLLHMPLSKAPEVLITGGSDKDFIYYYKHTIGCIGTLKQWLYRAYNLVLQEEALTLTRKHLERTKISGRRCEGMLQSALDGEKELQEILSEGEIEKKLTLKNSNQPESQKPAEDKGRANKPFTPNPRRDKTGTEQF
ncbi:AAA family ATPase [Desulfosporosinus sp. SYSU MS00001]|uniref:AAA family ATPase n=1 Tax=Desulfosporosinus sp. SYSU MS00001 TaxID=3416284 RepID=UPI003CF79318